MDRNYFNDALTLLDDTRDAEELAKLKKMLNKFWTQFSTNNWINSKGTAAPNEVRQSL